MKCIFATIVDYKLDGAGTNETATSAKVLPSASSTHDNS